MRADACWGSKCHGPAHPRFHEGRLFADLEYQGKKRKTRCELFLERMDGLIPWQSLEDRIRPFYPRAGMGRHPYPLLVMLRTHCVQLFYNLSDPGMEDPRFHGGRLCSTSPTRCAASWV